LADTGTLRSTPACPASVSSCRPGSWVSSETPPTATSMRRPARTTPAPPPSPAPRAPRRSCWPATPQPPTRHSNNGRSAQPPSLARPLPGVQIGDGARGEHQRVLQREGVLVGLSLVAFRHHVPDARQDQHRERRPGDPVDVLAAAFGTSVPAARSAGTRGTVP
jgi:hypothetical protein